MAQRPEGEATKKIRLGLFQESGDRFALAVHSDGAPERFYQRFSARGLRVALGVRPDGGTSLQWLSVPEEIAQVRNLLLEPMSRDRSCGIVGGVMALETASDSWHMIRLDGSAPGYHVALAFSFYPLLMSFMHGSLVQLGYEVATQRDTRAAWNVLHSAIAAQAAAILFPAAPTVADACALLASRPGVIDYLMALGETFSLADIEYLAGAPQPEISLTTSNARGAGGEDRTWMYAINPRQPAQ